MGPVTIEVVDYVRPSGLALRIDMKMGTMIYAE
jgi:hypothetical protein